jgi:hypothetical protein
MIKWFKRDDDKAMTKNKEGLLVRYREMHTCVMDDTSTYPHEEVGAYVAHAASSVAMATFTPSATRTTMTADAAVAHTTADTVCSARSHRRRPT